MKFVEKVIAMFGKRKSTQQPLPQITEAVQRNEQASVNVIRALEEYRDTETIRELSGRMK